MSNLSAQMSARDVSARERSELVAVARRFYVDDVSKVDLADELGVSRFKVARMLERARELGLVTITVHDEGSVDQELSVGLGEHLGLDEVLVVETAGDEPEVRRQIGVVAADLLSDTLSAGDVLGLAWGRTLTAMTESMRRLPPVAVVQLTGAVGSDLRESPVEIVRKVSQWAGSSAQAIFAPLLVEDAATAAALRRQPDVAAALRMFDVVTVAVVAVGSWDPPISQLRQVMSEEDRAVLEQRGVQAEAAGILIDADGRLVGQDFAARSLSISAEGMLRVPRVLAVAGGAPKAKAVLAVARSGLITSLVTDRALAEVVLAEPAVSSRQLARDTP
jgi:DNA-binding transcriptional regulator LsrR (DeoR family)